MIFKGKHYSCSHNTWTQGICDPQEYLSSATCQWTESAVGRSVCEHSKKTSTIICAALICVACDIPAARKVCVFLGHKATMGCSKCLLPFPTDSFGDKLDYSNFIRDQWTPRTNIHHRSGAVSYCSCNTRSEHIRIERRSGVHYSCLLQLPYFYAPRMCIIDPMQNLLLGTSKKIIELWKSNNVLTEKEFNEIQAKVDSFSCPSGVGRLPSKISSNFSGFTVNNGRIGPFTYFCKH